MNTPGNLANMNEGSIDAVISSPPYADSINTGLTDDSARERKAKRFAEGKIKISRPDIFISKKNIGAYAMWQSNYGISPGQLGSMKEGNFDICVSSPPYEGNRIGETGDVESNIRRKKEPKYGLSDGQLVHADNFWQASKEIVSQCYDLLKSGGHAIWVCKDYVKNKKRVPFSDRWLTLNESVGFKLVCRHQAMLIKDHGTQITINGEEKIQTERKSFFRRLAESKGSPRIDWEDILCFEKT